jgi:hypothetical protein
MPLRTKVVLIEGLLREARTLNVEDEFTAELPF